MKESSVTVIGSGLAGSEAAWALAQAGVRVNLFEMRPVKMTPAHQSSNAAELVCSNTFKSMEANSAHGILKDEMKKMGSLLIPLAEKNRVPAGKALAVDREAFSADVTSKLESHPNIEIFREEIKKFPDQGLIICATGPLTSDPLIDDLKKVGKIEGDLFFYDAISPILNVDSLDFDHLFQADRYEYENSEGDYLNAPLDRELYIEFIKAINEAEKVVPKDFEEKKIFEGCMPIEVMAFRGEDTLRFGPMKPVGLKDPRTQKRPYAVVQLRKENLEGTMWNIVGFQTRLKYPEQKRVFGMIPALKNAEYYRYGSIHRNTYVNSPRVLNSDLSLKNENRIFLAGQITGVEGYTESAACGILAARAVLARIQENQFLCPPSDTAMGVLLNYVLNGSGTESAKRDFQPSNVNFGLFPALGDQELGTAQPIEKIVRKRKKLSRAERRTRISERARASLEKWLLSESNGQEILEGEQVK